MRELRSRWAIYVGEARICHRTNYKRQYMNTSTTTLKANHDMQRSYPNKGACSGSRTLKRFRSGDDTTSTQSTHLHGVGVGVVVVVPILNDAGSAEVRGALMSLRRCLNGLTN